MALAFFLCNLKYGPFSFWMDIMHEHAATIQTLPQNFGALEALSPDDKSRNLAYLVWSGVCRNLVLLQ
jgi:hypothetical protein